MRMSPPDLLFLVPEPLAVDWGNQLSKIQYLFVPFIRADLNFRTSVIPALVLHEYRKKMRMFVPGAILSSPSRSLVDCGVASSRDLRGT